MGGEIKGLGSVSDIRSRLTHAQSAPEGDRIEALLLRLCAAVDELLALERDRLSLERARLSKGRSFGGFSPGPASFAPPSHLEPIPERALASLSLAERSLLASVREGLSNKEIAARRSTSVKTVKAQLTGVYKKLKVAGRGKLLARLR